VPPPPSVLNRTDPAANLLLVAPTLLLGAPVQGRARGEATPRQAGEEDAASVYVYTGTLRANSQVELRREGVV
jgi:hypothetical protein